MFDSKGPRDLTFEHAEEGITVQTRRVGYYPSDHPRYPSAMDSWVILCTVPGAIGPITERRTVTRGRWVR